MSVFEAIKAGDLESLRSTLAADPAAANARDANGTPAVLFALYYRRPELARLMLDYGADVDFFIACAMGLTSRVRSIIADDPEWIARYTPDGWTPLHFAAFFGQPEIARLLLEHGADPLARSKNSNANLPIHAAAAARQAAIVRILLEAGTPPDAKQEKGHTALHSAAQNNDRATMDVLFEHGARMDLPNDEGKTPADLLPSA